MTVSQSAAVDSGSAVGIPFRLKRPLRALADTRWTGGSDAVALELLDLDGNVLATGTSTVSGGEGSAHVGSGVLPAGDYAVRLRNHGSSSVTMTELRVAGVVSN